MAVNLRKSLRQLADNGRPHEIVMSAASKRLAATTESRKPIERRYALIVSVIFVVMSGCRALSLIPHNHTCPYSNPLFRSTVPWSAHVAAIQRQVPHPPRIPPPMTPHVTPHSPPCHAPCNAPYNAQYNAPYTPRQNLSRVVPQSLPTITQPIPPQGSSPVPVEDVVVEPPPTVVETLLALRQELEELRTDNADLTEKLETFQQGTERRTKLNQRTNILMKNVRDDLITVQSELNAWRSDLSTIRGRVRDQHTHQERTLVDVEKQLHDIILLYEDTESDSGK